MNHHIDLIGIRLNEGRSILQGDGDGSGAGCVEGEGGPGAGNLALVADAVLSSWTQALECRLACDWFANGTTSLEAFLLDNGAMILLDGNDQIDGFFGT